MITAKFRCSSVSFLTSPKDGENVKYAEKISFQASGDQEWSKYTPNGSIEMTITNENVWGKFVAEKSYALTFEEVQS